MTAMDARQGSCLLFGALAAPLALICAATPWPAVLLGLGLAAVNLRLVLGLDRRAPSPGLRVLGLLWTLLVLAGTARLSSACFQDATGFLPLVLLALAVVAREEIGRLGAVLWPTVAALLAGLLLFASADITWPHLRAGGGHTEQWMAVAAIALTPSALAVLAPGQSRGLPWGFGLASALGLAVSVVSAGVLGSLQGRLAQPLYQLMQGVSILGVAERLEALLSTALCVSCFLALSVLCALASAQVQALSSSARRAGWVAALAALALMRPVALLPEWAWFAATAVIAVGVPVGRLLTPVEKKIEIREKGG